MKELNTYDAAFLTSYGGWEKAKGLDRIDYIRMRQFGEDFEIFSLPGFTENIMSTIPFRIMYYVWYLNCIDRPFADNPRSQFVARALSALQKPSVINAFRISKLMGRQSDALVAEKAFVDAMNENSTQKMLRLSEHLALQASEVTSH